MQAKGSIWVGAKDDLYGAIAGHFSLFSEPEVKMAWDHVYEKRTGRVRSL